MKKILSLIFLVLISCAKQKVARNFTAVDVEVISKYNGSIRAIGLDAQKNLWMATENGDIGIYSGGKEMITSKISTDSIQPNFRSIAFSEKHTFVLSISNPALLFKIDMSHENNSGLVYTEDHEKVFYDSMAFWNKNEGIAMGDPTDDCLSIIITRDGGETWSKLSCDNLPKTEEGEAAFAASNTNIAIVGDKTWLVTGGKKSRVFYSPNKGKTWEVFMTPIVQGEGSQGIYSVDFYDDDNGIIFGGDYSKPDENIANKAITSDGGKTWQLVADGKEPGYRSCVQYVPNGNAKEIVAVGFKGISYSNDGGYTWKLLSDKSFYTIKFLNEYTAYAAGKNSIAKLIFRE